MNEAELVAYFSGMTEEQLDKITEGCDRDVVVPLATSSGNDYDFTDVEKERLATAEKTRKKLQKKLSRQQDGSNRRKGTNDEISKTYTKERNIRCDRAHKISHKLVKSDVRVFSFEPLFRRLVSCCGNAMP